MSSAHSGFELDPPLQRLKALPEGAAFGIAKAMLDSGSHLRHKLYRHPLARTGNAN